MKVPSYSIAKTFTVAALIRAGVDLNKEIGAYLDIDEHYARRQIKAVMQHTSGLPDYHALAEYRQDVADRKAAWPREEMFERALVIPNVELGKFAYSNIGYALLREVLEKLTGKSFFDAINETVFTPLEISNVASMTKLSDWDQVPEADESVRRYDPAWVYTGMVLATPDAMARTFEGIFSGQLFDPSLLLQPTTVDAPNHTFKEPGYGLGVMMDGARWVGHGGGGPGFALFALSYPDGRAAHVAYRASASENDSQLIQECLSVLER